MGWYVLRTFCGKEEMALSILKSIEAFSRFEIFCPKRRIGWRKSGRVISIIRPLFEGYLFVSINSKNILKFDFLLRSYKIGIVRLVRSAGSLVPISPEEKQLLQGLMDSGKVVEVSRLERVNTEYRVIDGPLLGYEHMIKKFSKRDRRITIEVPILQEKKILQLEGILVNSQQEREIN